MAPTDASNGKRRSAKYNTPTPIFFILISFFEGFR